MGVPGSYMGSNIVSDVHEQTGKEFMFPYVEPVISIDSKNISYVYIVSREELDHITARCRLESDEKVVLQYNKYNCSFITDEHHFMYIINLPSKVVSANFSAPKNIRVFFKNKTKSVSSKILLTSWSASNYQHSRPLFVQGEDCKFNTPSFASTLEHMHIFADSSPRFFIVSNHQHEMKYPAILFLNRSSIDFHKSSYVKKTSESVSKFKYEVPMNCLRSKAPNFQCVTQPTNFHWILYYS